MTLRTLSILYGDSLMFSSLIEMTTVFGMGLVAALLFSFLCLQLDRFESKFYKIVLFPGMRETHAAIRRRVLSTSFTCQVPTLAQLLPF